MAATRSRRDGPKRSAPVEKPVERANSLSTVEFLNKFDISSSLEQINLKLSSHVGQKLLVKLYSAADLKSANQNILDDCFGLIEQSSADDYKKSEVKWSPSSKRREMILPDMKYLVIQEKDSDATKGFVSFMVTYEDGFEVVYIYEIHLAPDTRGQGLGKLLMQMVEDIAVKVGVEKCMLTVFRSNETATKWYDHRGYIIDDFSPQPRILRNGTVKELSYLILSKSSKP